MLLVCRSILGGPFGVDIRQVSNLYDHTSYGQYNWLARRTWILPKELRPDSSLHNAPSRFIPICGSLQKNQGHLV